MEATETRKPSSGFDLSKKGNVWTINSEGNSCILDLTYKGKDGDGVYNTRIVIDPKVKKAVDVTGEILDLNGEVLGNFSSHTPITPKPSDELSLSSRIYSEEQPLEAPHSRTDEKLGDSSAELPNLTKSYDPRQLEALRKFSRSVKYASKLETMIVDGSIKVSDLEKAFKPLEVRGIKISLSFLSHLDWRPVEKVGDDYRINDEGIFSKIAYASSMMSSATGYLEKLKEKGLISPTKRTVTSKELHEVFRTKGEKIGVGNYLARLGNKGDVEIVREGGETKYTINAKLIA